MLCVLYVMCMYALMCVREVAFDIHESVLILVIIFFFFLNKNSHKVVRLIHIVSVNVICMGNHIRQ